MTLMDCFGSTIIDAQALSKGWCYPLGPRAHVLEESKEETSCSRVGSQCRKNKDEKREMVPGFSRFSRSAQQTASFYWLLFNAREFISPSFRCLQGGCLHLNWLP